MGGGLVRGRQREGTSGILDSTASSPKREREREGGTGKRETRRALLEERSSTLESRHRHRQRHASPGARKEKEETLGPPTRENKTQLWVETVTKSKRQQTQVCGGGVGKVHLRSENMDYETTGHKHQKGSRAGGMGWQGCGGVEEGEWAGGQGGRGGVEGRGGEEDRASQ